MGGLNKMNEAGNKNLPASVVLQRSVTSFRRCKADPYSIERSIRKPG